MSQLVAANKNSFHDIPVVKSIGGKNVETFNNTSSHQRRVFVQVSPTTAISSNVLLGQSLDFRIENPVDRIGSVYLRVDWSNTSGANFIHSGPTAMWIQQVQIFANNGATLLYQTNDPIQNWLISSILMSRNEHETTAALRGTDADYVTTTITENTATSGSYYIDLSPNFWRSVKLRPYCIDGNLLIKVKFQEAANIITSGTWTTSGVYLEMSGYMEDEQQKKLLLARSDKPKNFSYYAPQRHVETLTLAASSQYSVRMSINGWVNQLFFALRISTLATSVSGQFTFVRPENFDILDPQSKSLTGFKSQTANDMVMLYSHLYDNQFIANTGACVYSFSQTPLVDVKTGSFNGGELMQGYHILQFTTPATFVGGTYEVLIYAMCNESLIIEAGNIKATRS